VTVNLLIERFEMSVYYHHAHHEGTIRGVLWRCSWSQLQCRVVGQRTSDGEPSFLILAARISSRPVSSQPLLQPVSVSVPYHIQLANSNVTVGGPRASKTHTLGK